MLPCYTPFCRSACGITEPGSDYIILTGGGGTPNTPNTVAKYTLQVISIVYLVYTVTTLSIQGFVGNLPSLKIGRYGHGCGVFDTNTGQKVLYSIV